MDKERATAVALFLFPPLIAVRLPDMDIPLQPEEPEEAPFDLDIDYDGPYWIEPYETVDE